MVDRTNNRIASDIFAGINDPGEVFKNEYQISFIRLFMDMIRQAFVNVIRSDRAAPNIILQSPDGKSWNVTVNNAGQLTATVINRA